MHRGILPIDHDARRDDKIHIPLRSLGSTCFSVSASPVKPCSYVSRAEQVLSQGPETAVSSLVICIVLNSIRMVIGSRREL